MPLAVHDRLEGAHTDGGGLLGQFFNPLTGKAAKAHGHTITLGALHLVLPCYALRYPALHWTGCNGKRPAGL